MQKKPPTSKLLVLCKLVGELTWYLILAVEALTKWALLNWTWVLSYLFQGFCQEVSLLWSAVQNTQQPFFHMTYLKSDTTIQSAQRGQYVISVGTNICQNGSLELCWKMHCHFTEGRAETKHPGHPGKSHFVTVTEYSFFTNRKCIFCPLYCYVMSVAYIFCHLGWKALFKSNLL